MNVSLLNSGALNGGARRIEMLMITLNQIKNLDPCPLNEWDQNETRHFNELASDDQLFPVSEIYCCKWTRIACLEVFEGKLDHELRCLAVQSAKKVSPLMSQNSRKAFGIVVGLCKRRWPDRDKRYKILLRKARQFARDGMANVCNPWGKSYWLELAVARVALWLTADRKLAGACKGILLEVLTILEGYDLEIESDAQELNLSEWLKEK